MAGIHKETLKKKPTSVPLPHQQLVTSFDIKLCFRVLKITSVAMLLSLVIIKIWKLGPK